MPDALPPASAAFIVPCARVPAPLMWKIPKTCPTPFVVSTRLHARILSAPARRGSELDDAPVYVAIVAWNVSPPETEQVTWDLFETVVAAKVALAAWTDVALPAGTAGPRPRAAATPAAESATATINPSNASRFLDMVPLLVVLISGRS